MKNGIKIYVNNNNHEFLKQMADKEFRSVKATVEMIVVRYIENQLLDAEKKNTEVLKCQR